MTGFAPLNALIFAALGVFVFFAACSLAARIAPLDFWKHIAEERNLAAAILASGRGNARDRVDYRSRDALTD